MGYKLTAIKGISWIMMLRIFTRIITFVRIAILGRVLTPLEFGFFGIASLVLSLLEILTETGINIFLIQQKGDIREYINSAWVVSIIRGSFLALIIFLSAGFIASFFNSSESSNVIALIALVPFIRGFINPAVVLYQKDLLFDKEFKLRSVLFFVDVIISVIVGVVTKSAISFVYGLIASAVLEVILSYALFKIRPKLEFDTKRVKRVLSRGWPITVTGIFSYFADNGDNIVVGKILGSATLGIYQVAYKFSTLPISEITMVVNQVIFPIYSKFSDDRDRLKKALLRVTAANALGAMLLGFSIFIFAEPIILLVMGDQWVAAIPAVKILSIYGIIRTVFGSFSALFLSLGKQDYVAKMTFVRVAALAVLLVPFIMNFGMVGAGYAMLVSIIVEIPIILFFTAKIFK